MATKTRFKVADLGLEAAGRKRIDWAQARMPVLMALREQHARTRTARSS